MSDTQQPIGYEPKAQCDELSVYLAEYQVLTTRNTQWLALQNGIWPILLAFVALLLQLIPRFELSTILWLSLISVETAVLAYSGVGNESYNNVYYMESTLRPRIRELVGGRKVLGYESWVQRNRPSPQWLFDYGPVAILTSNSGLCYERTRACLYETR